MLSLLGMLFWTLAAVDVVLRLLGMPFTEVVWSPVVFLTLGLVFFALEALPKQEGNL